MKSASKSTDGKFRMRDLTERTGLPASTIHLYVRMGLLPKPTKTSRNQAWYDEQFVERLQLVRTLHLQANMPLSTIRDTLRKLPGPAALHTASVGLEEIVCAMVETLRLGPEKGSSELVSRKDLVERGVEPGDLDTLIRLELIAPAARGGAQRFSPIDVQIALAFAQMQRTFAPYDGAQADGMLAIIAAFVRYLKAMARAEAQEIARALVENSDSIPEGASEDLIRSAMAARDELVSAIHWKELALALEGLVSEGTVKPA